MGRRESPSFTGRDPKVQAAIDEAILENLQALGQAIREKVALGGLKRLEVEKLLDRFTKLVNAAKAPNNIIMAQVAPPALQLPVGRRDKIIEADVQDPDKKYRLLDAQERLLNKIDGT